MASSSSWGERLCHLNWEPRGPSKNGPMGGQRAEPWAKLLVLATMAGNGLIG